MFQKSKKRKALGKRKTRGMDSQRGPRTLARLLEETDLDPNKPNYLTAAAPPPKTAARRKFCHVCGFTSRYTCARCGAFYCCKKCYTIHVETRCLKFMV